LTITGSLGLRRFCLIGGKTVLCGRCWAGVPSAGFLFENKNEQWKSFPSPSKTDRIQMAQIKRIFTKILQLYTLNFN
ncbi:MAG: hypothetical protein K8R63_12165, partial [Bacteroidales bacterium]|nr:hypothetical protein [Bacteroidales bacterium]